LRNFFSLYEPLASTWSLHDSSGPEPRLVAERLESQPLRAYDGAVWAVVKRQAPISHRWTMVGSALRTDTVKNAPAIAPTNCRQRTAPAVSPAEFERTEGVSKSDTN
jgi:hypothetical protein